VGRSGWRRLARGRVVALLPCTQMHSVAFARLACSLKVLARVLHAASSAVFCTVKTRPVEFVQPQEQPVVFVFQFGFLGSAQKRALLTPWLGVLCLQWHACPTQSP